MPLTDPPFISSRPRIRIDGQDRANLGEAALAMSIHLPRTGMASAELRLLNWGPNSSGQADFLNQDIRLGQRIELLLGETADAPAFTGYITAIEERYGDGAPQCVILAEDALHKLARIRHNRVFEDMSLDNVIAEIASEVNLQSDINVTTASATWLQINESNLAFLLRQLLPYDVALRLHEGRLRARDDEDDPNPVRLDPESAHKIRIIADLNHQPQEVAINGYNLDADSSVSGTANSISPAPRGQTSASILSNLNWAGASILPHPFARNQDQAAALATRQFRQRARRFLHGEIICQGNSRLQSGSEVELNNVSPRLAGRYRVMECWHLFDFREGLRTRLRVERPDWNANP